MSITIRPDPAAAVFPWKRLDEMLATSVALSKPDLSSMSGKDEAVERNAFFEAVRLNAPDSTEKTRALGVLLKIFSLRIASANPISKPLPFSMKMFRFADISLYCSA
jgi:hypothetical protein